MAGVAFQKLNNSGTTAQFTLDEIKNIKDLLSESIPLNQKFQVDLLKRIQSLHNTLNESLMPELYKLAKMYSPDKVLTPLQFSINLSTNNFRNFNDSNLYYGKLQISIGIDNTQKGRNLFNLTIFKNSLIQQKFKVGYKGTDGWLMNSHVFEYTGYFDAIQFSKGIARDYNGECTIEFQGFKIGEGSSIPDDPKLNEPDETELPNGPQGPNEPNSKIGTILIPKNSALQLIFYSKSDSKWEDVNLISYAAINSPYDEYYNISPNYLFMHFMYSSNRVYVVLKENNKEIYLMQTEHEDRVLIPLDVTKEYEYLFVPMDEREKSVKYKAGMHFIIQTLDSDSEKENYEINATEDGILTFPKKVLNFNISYLGSTPLNFVFQGSSKINNIPEKSNSSAPWNLFDSPNINLQFK